MLVLASVLFCTRAFGPRLFTTASPGNASAQIVEAAFVFMAAVVVAGPLFVLGVAEATTQSVALARADRETGVGDERSPIERARFAFPRAFGAGLLAYGAVCVVPAFSFGLMAAGGYLAGVTSGNDATAGLLALAGGFGLLFGLLFALWAIGAYALAPACALRGAGVRAALGESRRLMAASGGVSGGLGAVWVVYGVLGIAVIAETVGLSLAVELLPLAGAIPGAGLFAEAISLGTPFVVAWTLLPLWGVAVAVIDVERRVRKEGYDVELLARG